MMNSSIIVPFDVFTTERQVLESIPENEHMSHLSYLLTAMTLFFIGFFGFFLNLFVIILMCKDIQMWTPMNIILLNLVCSDFSVSIIGNPFALLSAWNHKWIFGQAICIAYGFFMSLLGITSIVTLTVLAYERYCLVTHPFSSSHLTYRGAKFCVIFIWTYSFIVTSPPLFGWGEYVSEAANISCSVNWETHSFNAMTYIIFLFFFGLIVPVCVISYSYVMIIRTMRENTVRAGKVNKMESRVTSMIAIMIVAFLVAWTPYSIFALSEQFGDPELISPALAVLPALIAKSSICYNPCIYVISNSQFRASWRRVFGKEVLPSNTINDTVVHQISEMSSRVVVECTFINSDKKKRKEKLKGSRKKNGRNSLNDNKIGKSEKELSVLIKDGENSNISNIELSNFDEIPNVFLNNNQTMSDHCSQSPCEYEMKMLFTVSNKDANEELSETIDEVICE